MSSTAFLEKRKLNRLFDFELRMGFNLFLNGLAFQEMDSGFFFFFKCLNRLYIQFYGILIS